MSEFSFDKLAALLRNRLGVGRTSKQIETALHLAWDGHNGQYRERYNKDDPKIPYVVHPIGVALLALELMPLLALPDNLDDIISVCLTHDLLEDCDVAAYELAAATSTRTSELVEALTKPPSKEGGGSKRRNEEAFAKIVNAGPTAMFVKICDHLQNISRPQNTPPALLRKALRKGWGANLRYFESDALSAALRDEYVKRLRTAEEVCSAIYKDKEAAPVFASLADAITYSVMQTEAKMLEVHDIVDVIKTVSGARFALISNADGFMDLILDAQTLRSNQKLGTRIRKLIGEGSFTTKDIQGGAGSGLLMDIDHVFTIPLQLPSSSPRGGDLLFLGFDAVSSADWLNRDSLRVLVSFLSDRLRDHTRKSRAALATRLAELGLRVSAEDVEYLHLANSDLEKLRAALRRADLVREIIVARLTYDFGREDRRSEFPRLESRTKDPASLIKKMISRKHRNIAQVDDVIGIRVICGTDNESAEISEQATRIIQSVFQRDQSSSDFWVDNVILNDVRSKAGYRARHLTFIIGVTEPPDTRIGCEIQFRSAFQDAWARLSHDMYYKLRLSNSRSNAEGMEQLVAMRDEMDALVNKIAQK